MMLGPITTTPPLCGAGNDRRGSRNIQRIEDALMNTKMLVMTLTIAASLAHVAGDAVAACGPDAFKIESFEPSEKTRAGGRKVYSLKGVLVNTCAEAAAAELKIDAKNDDGQILRTETGWPAGSNNIAAGASAPFDLGPLFRYDDKIKYFGISISNTKSW